MFAVVPVAVYVRLICTINLVMQTEVYRLTVRFYKCGSDMNA